MNWTAIGSDILHDALEGGMWGWIIVLSLVVVMIFGPLVVFLVARRRHRSWAAAGVTAMCPWVLAIGFLLFVIVQSEQEYRLFLVGASLTVAILSVLALAPAVLISKLRESGQL